MKRAVLTLGLALTLLVPGQALAARDRDRDRLPDRWEKRHGLSTKSKSGSKDNDRDGINNRGEYRAKTNPKRRDSDRDGIRDGEEDFDADAVDTRNELRASTHPRKPDSDRDGTPDGSEDSDRDGLTDAQEDASGNDPIDKDSDDDEYNDDTEGAGVVVGFDGDRLVIDTYTRGQVTALVSEDTEINCYSEKELEHYTKYEQYGNDPEAGEDGEEDLSDELFGPDEEDEEWTDEGEEAEVEGEGDGATPPERCGTSAVEPGQVVHESEAVEAGNENEFFIIELVK